MDPTWSQPPHLPWNPTIHYTPRCVFGLHAQSSETNSENCSPFENHSYSRLLIWINTLLIYYLYNQHRFLCTMVLPECRRFSSCTLVPRAIWWTEWSKVGQSWNTYRWQVSLLPKGNKIECSKETNVQYFIRGKLWHVICCLCITSTPHVLQGLIETLRLSLPSEKRTQYQLEAKFAADGHPVLLSVNVTHGLNRKISVSAKLRNVFIKDASFSGKSFIFGQY